MNNNIELETIMSIANKVYSMLGVGHTKAIYHRAMELELQRNNIEYKSKVPSPIVLFGEVIGHKKTDLIINKKCKSVIISLNVLPSMSFDDNVTNKLKSCMKSLDIVHGLIINFPKMFGKDECNFEIIELK